MTANSNSVETIYRLALVSSGAIALGAYEAGVLAQLYHDLHVFNRLRQGRARILIDAVAGSSAGSLTGLILAHAIALEHDPQTFADDMWRAWVQSADVLSLLTPFSSPAEALFSNQCVQRIAAQAIREPAEDTPFDPTRVVAIWMTMTNLDGIPQVTRFPRAAPNQPDVQFYSLAYRDYAPYFICGSALRYVTIPTEALSPPGLQAWMQRLVRARYQGPTAPTTASEDWWWYSKPAAWSEAREYAINSGSFPFAFQSRPVPRDLALYPRYTEFRDDPDVQKELPAGPLPDTAFFQCVDGGLFNNQPIGRAIDAVSYLEKLDPARDPAQNSRTQRVFLVIEPDPNTHKQMDTLIRAGGDPSPNGLMPTTLAGKIISAYFNDALYSDIQKAVETNQKLENLEKLASPTNAERPVLDPSQLEAVKEALEMGYKRVITLEHIPYRSVMVDRLAGDWAGHFGGFLQRNLREADFKTGQHEARQWFLTWLQANLPAHAVQPADLDDTSPSTSRTYSALGTPPDPQIEQSRLADMNWGQLGFGRRVAIGCKGFLRGLWLALRWLWPVMLLLFILLILAAFGLHALAGAYGAIIYFLALLAVAMPFIVLKILALRKR